MDKKKAVYTNISGVLLGRGSKKSLLASKQQTTDERTDGRTNGRTDERTDGRTEGHGHYLSCSSQLKMYRAAPKMKICVCASVGEYMEWFRERNASV